MLRTKYRDRGRGRAGHNDGRSYDPDAQAYIAATGELFPDALNDLVLGIKSAGLWADHIDSIKKAIGVPSLAASVVDLRNPAFNGTAVNAPGHDPETGWSFVGASSQYIDSAWHADKANSKASLNSIHIGVRLLVRSGGFTARAVKANNIAVGWHQIEPGVQRVSLNEAEASRMQSSANPYTPGHYIGSRTGASARASYKDGILIANDTVSPVETVPYNLYIGARNVFDESVDLFLTGRISLVHCGAGLTAQQAADLTDLFDAYAAAAGEA